MANLGWFDPELIDDSWFDPELVLLAQFDKELADLAQAVLEAIVMMAPISGY